ncbi:MAG: metallopeptidase family protein [Desulfosarcina sp.]
MANNPPKLSPEAFDRIVEQAIARIPIEIRQHLDNILISVQQRPSDEMLQEMGLPPGEALFGVYWGVPLTERSVIDPPLYPDTIFLFQEPLEQMCATQADLVEEIEITVVHEIAHALGLGEEQIAALGYG